MTCSGAVHIAGESKGSDATSELKNKILDMLENHPSFYVFNRHGQVLFWLLVTTNTSNSDSRSSNTSLKLQKLTQLCS